MKTTGFNSYVQPSGSSENIDRDSIEFSLKHLFFLYSWGTLAVYIPLYVVKHGMNNTLLLWLAASCEVVLLVIFKVIVHLKAKTNH